MQLPRDSKITIVRPPVSLKVPEAAQFKGWLAQDCGVYTRDLLVEKIEDLKESWMNGDFTAETNEKSIQLNAEAIGKAQAYADIILTLEEVSDEQSGADEEQDVTY